MRCPLTLRGFLALATLGLATLAAQSPAAWIDPSPHKISLVPGDKDVRLEVLDWGGSGRTLVLLAGLGDNAHVFDDFAPKLTQGYHVLAISRRGFGASTIALSGYDANRLGDDVLAVLDSLKLERPVLVGHSIAGEELSSIGSRHPESVAGLVYLDSAYQYAFDNGMGATMAELQEGAKALPPQSEPATSDLASYSAFLDWWVRTRGFKIPEAMLRQARPPDNEGRPGKPRTAAGIRQRVQDGIAKLSHIDVPVLALCAMPQVNRPDLHNSTDPKVRAAAEAYDAHSNVAKEKQLKSFEEGIPHSRVVRIANANHYIWISNEAEVLREMRAFLLTLR